MSSLSPSFTRTLFLSLRLPGAISFLLARLSPGHSQPSSFVLAFLPVTLSFPFCLPVSPVSPTAGPGDNTNAKAFTPLWLPKWNKFFNSRIYRRANESPARCRRDNIRRTKEDRFLAELFIRGVSFSKISVLTKSKTSFGER